MRIPSLPATTGEKILQQSARLVGGFATLGHRHFKAQRIAAAVCRTWAQEPNFSAGVDVVALLANVRDREGSIVKNLNREDLLVNQLWRA
jgi:hypothetical protein